MLHNPWFIHGCVGISWLVTSGRIHAGVQSSHYNPVATWEHPSELWEQSHFPKMVNFLMYWLNCFQPQQYNRKAFLSLLPFSTHNEIKYRCLNADGRIPAEVTKLNLHSWETGAVGHANFAQHLTLKVKACSISHFTAPGVVEGKLSVFHFMLKSSCDSANLNWTVHYWQAEDNKVPKQSGSVWSAHSYSQCIKYSKRGQCSYASTWSCSYPYNVTAWSALWVH